MLVETQQVLQFVLLVILVVKFASLIQISKNLCAQYAKPDLILKQQILTAILQVLVLQVAIIMLLWQHAIFVPKELLLVLQI